MSFQKTPPTSITQSNLKEHASHNIKSKTIYSKHCFFLQCCDVTSRGLVSCKPLWETTVKVIKLTFPSKYATMCIILIKNSSHPEKTKYPLLNISVQWFSWSKLHSNPAHPINAPNISHTLWTAFVFRIVTTKSPKGLQVVVGSWQKNPKPRILWSQKLFFLFQHLRTTPNIGFLTTQIFELLFSILFYLSFFLCFCFTILKSESFLCYCGFVSFVAQSKTVSGYPWLGMFDEKIHSVSLASFFLWLGRYRYLPKVDRSELANLAWLKKTEKHLSTEVRSIIH